MYRRIEQKLDGGDLDSGSEVWQWEGPHLMRLEYIGISGMSRYPRLLPNLESKANRKPSQVGLAC